MNRDEFFQILAQTTNEIDGFVAREPAYPVWRQLQQQLHAMQQWTANGQQPTAEQCARVSIGLIAARELEPAPPDLEALVSRLHQLNYHWRHWRTPEQPPAKQFPTKTVLWVLAAVAGTILLAGVACTQALSKHSVGQPVGTAFRTNDRIAILISTEEFSLPKLFANSGRNGYSLELLLHPVDGTTSTRTFPIARNVAASALNFGIRILGDDGRYLWLYANGIHGVDRKTGEIVTEKDLRRANPTLGDPFTNGRYELAGRLHLTTHDYRQSYEIDPATLRAQPSERLPNKDPFHYADRLESYLDSSKTQSKASLLRSAPNAAALRLTEPESFLEIYPSHGTKALARVDPAGQPIWTAETGIQDLKQVLPDPQTTALIGTKPAQPNRLPEPVLVIINNRTGAIATTTLWR